MSFPRTVSLWLFVAVLFSMCGKNTGSNTGVTGGGTTTNGTVGGYTEVPLPTASLTNLIIPNLAALHVTNKGPYVQMQNTNQLKWSFYKYRGGTGASAWLSYVPTFAATYYRPVTMYYESTADVFSMYWLSNDKYGMYNMNTGTPSFEFTVPGTPNGPGIFSEIIPPTKATNSGRFWALSSNDIWKESAVVVPKKFDFVLALPSTVQRLISDPIMADPDSDAEIWMAASSRLYRISEVGNPTAPYGKIVQSWNFSTLSATDRLRAILKVNGIIYIQFGAKVYKQNGTSFNSIGTLNVSDNVFPSICTNGSTIFAADGRYYDNNAGTWKSFIGDGTNLSTANQAAYQKLKAACSGNSPIGCLYGSGSGPVYLLNPTSLIIINPLF